VSCHENQRVRGSSPWRRTGPDLALLRGVTPGAGTVAMELAMDSLLTMATTRRTGKSERGSVRTRGGSHQVIVYAGVDPVTGKDLYLRESTRDEKKVPEIRSRLLAKVDQQRRDERHPGVHDRCLAERARGR
jgi:hypothetical protein